MLKLPLIGLLHRALTRETLLRSTAVVILLICITTASWIWRRLGPLDFRWDGGIYYVLGTSLARGEGYRLLNEPGDIRAIQYPPGLPVIVALHQKLLGTEDPLVVGNWMRHTWSILHLLLVLLTYALIRRYLPMTYALAGAVTVAVHVDSNFLATLCFSELPFAVISTTFLLLSTSKPASRIHQPLAAIAAICAFALRTVGIAALGAWVAQSVLRRQWKQAGVRSLIAAVPVLLWFGYVHQVEKSYDYAHPAYEYQRADYAFYNVSYATNMALKDPFAPHKGHVTLQDRYRSMAENVRDLAYNLGVSITKERLLWAAIAGRYPTISRFLGGVNPLLFLLGVAVLGGLTVLLNRGDRLLVVYIVLTLLASMAAPWRVQMWRYNWPLLPALLVALFVAVQKFELLGRSSRGYFRIVGHLLPSAVLWGVFAVNLVFLVKVAQQDRTLHTYRNTQGNEGRYSPLYYDEPWRQMDSAISWLQQHAKRTDLVVTSIPGWVHIRTGLKAIVPPFELDPERGRKLIAATGATYVVLDHVDGGGAFMNHYSAPAMKGAGATWRPALTIDGEVLIYERQPQPSVP